MFLAAVQMARSLHSDVSQHLNSTAGYKDKIATCELTYYRDHILQPDLLACRRHWFPAIVCEPGEVFADIRARCKIWGKLLSKG